MSQDGGDPSGRRPPAARLSGVSKRFGSVAALQGVDLELAPGEIHGILGENGAGKTTLARILAGLITPDGGQVDIAGRPVALTSARAARAMGVAMVHQHFSLVDRFTGLANVALFNPGAWTRAGTPRPGYRGTVESRARELNLDVALDVPVGLLGVGDRQRIEILKALMTGTRVLLLDEPTAVLAPGEIEGLFAVLDAVARSGTAIGLVSHRLDEVFAVTRRATVLRRGRRILTGETGSLTQQHLAQAMIGEPSGARTGRRTHVPGQARARRRARTVAHRNTEEAKSAPTGADPSATAMHVESPADAAPATVVASLEHVGVGTRVRARLTDVTLQVRRGEIVGIAGVDGNGQRTLAAVLAGTRRPDTGTAALPRRIGWIPQDRDREGLVGTFTITENVALAFHGAREHRRGPWLEWHSLRQRATQVIQEMDVRCPSPNVAAQTLSGGNQQRVVAGREFLRAQDLLVAEQPTRGLDIRATSAVRERIVRLARGASVPLPPPGIVLVSGDLDEICDLADRVYVMVRGRLVFVGSGEHNPETIGSRMLGAVSDS